MAPLQPQSPVPSSTSSNWPATPSTQTQTPNDHGARPPAPRPCQGPAGFTASLPSQPSQQRGPQLPVPQASGVGPMQLALPVPQTAPVGAMQLGRLPAVPIASQQPPSHQNLQLAVPRPSGPALERSHYALASTSLTFKDLEFKVTVKGGEERTILESCSGHFESGQLVALMGPSGCGKSTLLDIIGMQKTSKYSGDVYVNGHVRDARLFRRIAAYVGQEDVMPQHWKVHEAIRFNAALKNCSSSKVDEGVVALLLEAFGLAGVAETYIGGPAVRGISGGQRRRVTLARGVAAQASVMFCDEPTSGLSATDAEVCIKALQLIAKRLGVLIVVVIHQPRIEVAEMFDTLVLLTSNPGRMVYLGPMANAAGHMAELGRPVPPYVNPTDYFLDLITPGLSLDCSDRFVAYFQEHMKPGIRAEVRSAIQNKGETIQAILAGNPGTYAVPFSSQFSMLLRRKLSITLRNPLAIGLPLILPLLMGVVVGTMFLNTGSMDIVQQVRFIFILITVLGLGGLQIMPILIEERTFMKYETNEALYSEGASALASFSVDVPLAFMGAAYQVLLMYVIAGMPAAHLPTTFFWCMMLFLVYDSLFALVAAIAEDAQSAQAIATPVVSVFMLFNGFVISKVTCPGWLLWLFEVSPNWFAMQGVVVEVAKDFGATGQFAIDVAGFSAHGDAHGIAVMVGMIVLFRACQLVALKKLHRIQK